MSDAKNPPSAGKTAAQGLETIIDCKIHLLKAKLKQAKLNKDSLESALHIFDTNLKLDSLEIPAKLETVYLYTIANILESLYSELSENTRKQLDQQKCQSKEYTKDIARLFSRVMDSVAEYKKIPPLQQKAEIQPAQANLQQKTEIIYKSSTVAVPKPKTEILPQKLDTIVEYKKEDVKEIPQNNYFPCTFFTPHTNEMSSAYATTAEKEKLRSALLAAKVTGIEGMHELFIKFMQPARSQNKFFAFNKTDLSGKQQNDLKHYIKAGYFVIGRWQGKEIVSLIYPKPAKLSSPDSSKH
jgi:hypothetical protein